MELALLIYAGNDCGHADANGKSVYIVTGTQQLTWNHPQREAHTASTSNVETSSSANSNGERLEIAFALQMYSSNTQIGSGSAALVKYD